MQPVSIPKFDADVKSDDIIATFLANIETWKKRVLSLQQEKERENSPEKEAALKEIEQLNQFLSGRLTKRLLAIKKYEESLRLKYLKCIEPYYTEIGISQFITQYFEIEVFKQVRLRYRKKKDFEKEVNVLFDLYKVKKTIETITTLQKSAESDTPFPSQFDKAEQAEFLKTLKEIFKLFFLRFVKKEYRKALFQSLSESRLEMDEIIAMRKSGTSYIEPAIFETIEYREKFITVFFSTLLRTKTSIEIKDLHFNYLNFELLKHEFLNNWMLSKLKGNPEKDKVLQNYKVGGKSVAQMIKENPEKEAEILSSLPIGIFNDIAEQVNQNVKQEDKTPVSTFSQNHGVFGRLQTTFTKVKQIARFSVEKMEEMRPKTGIWTVKNKRTGPLKPIQPAKVKEKEPPKTASPEAAKELKIQYGLEVLNENEMDFAYFDRRPDTYKAKFGFLKKKLGTEYDAFAKKVWKLLNLVSKDQILMRQEPNHEWVIPLLFAHGDNLFLLAVGAEIALKDHPAGYKSEFKEAQHTLNCFYVFATQTPNSNFGKVMDQRKVRNAAFNQYSYAEKTVHNTVMTLIDRTFHSHDKKIFKSSTLNYRKHDQSYPELEELKKLLGLVKADTTTENPSQPAADSAPAEPAKPRDISQIAGDLKKEMEDAKKAPAPPKAEPKGISAVAAQLKKEMEEAKQAPKPEPAQKPSGINAVAAQLKKEMEEAKQTQPPPKTEPKGIDAVAAQLKKEMAEAKQTLKTAPPKKASGIDAVAAELKKEMEQAKQDQSPPPSNEPKGIAAVAAQVKTEMEEAKQSLK